MNDDARNRYTHRLRTISTIVLVLALLTSPALCCGGIQLVDSLPSSWLPASLSFSVNLFEAGARVENTTSETLYVTAITTTHGDARVIPQNIALRQRDIPVQPQGSVVLQYDAADLPLSGIAVCRNTEDCRLLPVNNVDTYEVNSYENLEQLEPGWLQAIQATPVQNYGVLIIYMLGLIPIFLFSAWMFLKRREKQTFA